MRFKIVIFLIALFMWVLLTFSFAGQDLLAGVVVGVFSAVYFGKLMDRPAKKCLEIKRYLWFLYFVPVFLYYCVKANISMAYRVLHPKLPIKPGIVRIKTTLKSGIARAFLANAITLTPGTMTVDIIEDRLYIHWIYVASSDQEEKKQAICEQFEDILRRVFE